MRSILICIVLLSMGSCASTTLSYSKVVIVNENTTLMEDVVINGFVRDYATTVSYENIAVSSPSSEKEVLINHHYSSLLQTGNSPLIQMVVNYRMGQETIESIVFYYQNWDDFMNNNPSGQILRDRKKYLVKVKGTSATLEELMD